MSEILLILDELQTAEIRLDDAPFNYPPPTDVADNDQDPLIFPGDDTELLSLVSDLVDAFARSRDPWTLANNQIDVIATIDHCLEIGCTMLGSGSVRSANEADRVRSPLRLFPYATTERVGDAAARAALLDLYDSGAFDHPDGRSGLLEYRASLAEAISAYQRLNQFETRPHVLFSHAPAEFLLDFNPGRRVSLLTDRALERAINEVRLPTNEVDERWSGYVRAGRRMGVQFAHLATQLGLEEFPPQQLREGENRLLDQ